MLFDTANPDHVRALERLDSDIPIWLTTVDPEGQPQSSPVWFVWDGEVFHLWSKPGAPKVRNMRANPRVSLHLQADETADKDIVILEGVAEVDAEPSDGWFPAYIEKYRAVIESYGWTPGEGEAAEYSLSFRIRPTRVRVE